MNIDSSDPIISMDNIQDYEMQLRRLSSEINIEDKKNKYLMQELQKKKMDIETINNDIKKMKKVMEKNNEQEKVLKKEETKLKPSSETLNNSNIGTKKYLLYGNHIDNLKPKYLGKARAFCYINNYPIIIIGPDCKFYFSFKFI